MGDRQKAEAQTLLKKRVRNLFQFLFEANRLRFRPERKLEEQIRVLALTGLPEHPSIQLIHPCSGNSEQDPAEFELRVSRPRLTRCPLPPEIIEEWLLSGWDDPAIQPKHTESLNETDQDGNTVTVHFADDALRVQSWMQWVQERHAWVSPELLARTALAFFEKLYELHSLLGNEGERVELMVGDGMLSWQVHSSSEKAKIEINHPILLKRVELLFDPQKPEFRVVDTDREPELYTSLLIDLVGINIAGINQRQMDLESSSYHPMGFDDTSGFLKAFVQTISPTNGEFADNRCEEISESPHMWREPVLFARRRTTGFANSIGRILEDIDHRTIFPSAFGQITGVVKQEWDGTDFGGEDLKEAGKEELFDDDTILLAKETNNEQLQIIRRLAVAGSVLVQGPPGTGKTHTIGNIIGHLLAQGQRVLVTSHTPKALRVLRNQIPTDLQALCVSVLGSDVEARTQLEASVTAISERLARDSVATLKSKIEQRSKERLAILERNRTLTRQLREALESEYLPIVINDTDMTPAQAARYVAANQDKHSWIPRPVTWGEKLPLNEEDLAFLYSTNQHFTADEEQDSWQPLPAIAELLSPDEFNLIVSDMSSLLVTELHFKRELWNEGASIDSEQLATIWDDVCKEFTDSCQRHSWRPYAIVAGMRGGTHRETWQMLSRKINDAVELSAQNTLHVHYKATLSNQMVLSRQCDIINEILMHLDKGGKVGTVQLMTKPDWRKLVKTSSVSSGNPERREHYHALHILAKLTILREEISCLWTELITNKGGRSFNELGSSPELAAQPLAEEIIRCIDWHSAVWAPMLQKFNEIGLLIEKVLADVPREPSLTADYDYADKACTQLLPPIIEAQVRRLRLAECEATLQRLLKQLQQGGTEAVNRGCISLLISAIRAKDVSLYQKAYAYTARLHTLTPVVRKRKELITRLAAAAPAWASAIASRVSPHNQRMVPGPASPAWTWRQLEEELTRRNELNPQTLQREIEENRQTLREVTIALIEAKSWARQLDRVGKDQAMRQALVGWLDTFKKLKSTQKADIRWRLVTHARQLMKLSARAVPVWIMPLAAVAENFDQATNRFDIVIIDEASQADLNALIAIYQADKVLIVGDHEQVTPEAVGKDQTLIHNLIDTYLKDIPNSTLFDNRFSIYDLGRQAFGDAICLVEHFRCVPEIIAFSNKLSYNGRIRPLREATSTHLKPACIPFRVDGVGLNQVNVKEADTIVSLIKAMCKHSAYDGKTIGVIAMVGDSQALQIDQMLRKELDPIQYSTRRIICGNSASFQGDERDVMFLSMVDSGKDNGDGPLVKRGEGAYEMYKKRYNVAASRAKDQVWVIHSLDPDNDLKLNDLRRELIIHAKDPAATMRLFEQEEKRTESEFEREVLRILVNKGYKVRTQWKVGYYRIDMVVEGGGKRLAVECDGDRWHPIEKLAEDMARQAVLERLKWTFVRIRGSAFFRNPDAAMRPVFERLDSMEIPPISEQSSESDMGNALIKELLEMAADEHDDASEEEEARQQYSWTAAQDDTKGNPLQERTGMSAQQGMFVSEFRNWLDVIAETHAEYGDIEHETFMRIVAKKNGYQRLGTRVRKEIERAFKRYQNKIMKRKV